MLNVETASSSLPKNAAEVLPPDLAELYPFSRHYFTLPDGARMHYVDEGQGPVVLMLHGNPTWSWMYRNLIKSLSGRFRCIAPDHIGCGFSDKPQDYPYTLAQHIRNVRSLLDGLGIAHFNLVAHDWGGAIGMGLAGFTPDQVGRIALMNTAAYTSMEIPARIAVCKVPGLGAFLIRGLNAFAGGAAHMAVVKPLSHSVKRGFLWPYRSWRDRVANLRFVQDIPLNKRHPSYATLERVEKCLPFLQDKPMLLCWGMRDWCFTPRFLDGFTCRFPKAEVEVYESGGHYLLEDEGERVIARIAAFLSKE
jgi:cis-3-alkyl-4-acyloxetan-2-one decarboxylase